MYEPQKQYIKKMKLVTKVNIFYASIHKKYAKAVNP